MSIVYSCGECNNEYEPEGSFFHDEKQDGRPKQPVKKIFNSPEERRRFEEEFQRGEDN